MSKDYFVAYYSHSSNTRRIAELIRDAVGGPLSAIEPAILYPDAYDAVVKQAKQEIQAGYRPPLKSRIADLKPYRVIFIGSPNWWNTIAPPVASFLAESDLAGKTIAPFITHGGGGQGRCARDIAALCPDSKVLKEFAIYGDGADSAQARIMAWLREIGCIG